MDILALVSAFFADQRTVLLIVLVVADLLSGIIAALRSRTFAWERVADWLLKNMGYVIGYLVWYVFTGAAVQDALAGLDLDAILNTAGWGTAVAALVASIGNNLRQASAVTAAEAHRVP